MKKLFTFLSFAACLVACSKDESEPEFDPPKPPAAISLSANSFTVPYQGETLTLTVTAPQRPSLSGQPDWISVSENGVYKDYELRFDLKVAANTSAEERSATLTVHSGSLSQTLSIRQSALEQPHLNIDSGLTAKTSSAAAVKVYDFLRENAGLKMLSGVQSGGTANNNERINQIYGMTGKHPALAGYDYIFLQYSPTPDNWSWKVNYEDISAAKEQWANNGLVSFMWHWNVPTSEEAWNNGKNGNFEGYNFYCKDTAFSIERALTEGTWEHDFILQDIEKVAGYLKLLQAEGIPVLWRPLHEAAGNYTLYGSNGAWFWWGRGGAEPCKALWKLLRDKLEGEYGLDNLIWVWTLDATVGAEADYAKWYPGNDLVDIVGVDIYAEDTEAKARQYQAAVTLSGGRKLVTVSECGNIPDPEKCIVAGQTWSWFLTWDLESYKLNTESYWKTLMASPMVLTREQMPSLK